MQYLLMSRSMTYAQRSVKTLERAGIAASVIRAPRTAGAKGCGYCAAVSERNGKRALEILEKAGMKPEKIFRREPDGTIREAAL